METTTEKYLVSEQTLTTRGFQLGLYPANLKLAVQKLAAILPKFFDQPWDHKSQYKMEIQGGYEDPETTGRADNKETFSFSKSFEWDAVEHIYSGIDIEVFVRANLVLDLVKEEMKQFAILVEQVSGKQGIKDRWMKFFEQWTLRMLHYFPTNERLLAEPHADRGTATCVLWESIPGHQNLDLYDLEIWRDITVNDELILFLGVVGQLLTDCELIGLCHRVVSTNESRANGRYSIVLFIDTDIYFNKDKYGNARKEFGVGGNYLYTPERNYEFAERFTLEPQV